MRQFNFQSFFSKFPNIDLGDIKLRDLRISDKENYYNMLSDPEVSKYISDEDVPSSIEQAVSEVRFWGGLFYQKQSVFWSIADGKKDEMIGTIGFSSWNFYNNRAEICYDLMKEHWGKGIMTKALTNVIQFAFNKMFLNRIEARTMIGNEASQNLLRKIGFKEEGVIREYRMIRGAYVDIKLFSLLRKEYPGFLLS